MESYIQILCRFQKSKRKVPQPSPISTKKSALPFYNHLLLRHQNVSTFVEKLLGTSHLKISQLYGCLLLGNQTNSA